MRSLIVLLSFIMISFSFISCDQIPEEGTIKYDIDFPSADSCEAQGTCDDGSSGGGGTYVPPVITPSIPSIPSYVTVVNPTFTETEGNTYTGTTIVLDSQPSGTVTISFTSGDTSEVTVNTPTLTFTPANYSTPQVIVMTAEEDYINIPTDSNTTTGIAFSISSTNTSDLVHGRIGNLVGYVLDSGRTLFTIGGGTPTVPEGQSDNSSYTFVLNDMPNGVITVTLTSTDTDEVLIGSPLVFTPGSYNVPQNLSLTGVEDYIVDGLQDTNITVTYTSTDPTDIQHGETNTFVVNTTDSGQSSVTLSDPNPSVAEGSSYTGTIVLDEAPAGTVTITLTSDDVGEAQLVPDPTVLTFTPGNWNSPQNYTVNGIEDLEIDGPVETNINIVASSTDPTDSIDGLNTSFTVTTTDSGIDGPYTINPTTPSVTEGTTDNMTFVLNYPPTDTVTITLTSGGADEADISPTTLTFTPGNWNMPQTVVVTGVEDFVNDNDQSTAITTTISSNDPIYDNSTDYFNVTTEDSGISPATITSAVAGNQQVTLNWSGPAGMDGYVIYYTSDGSTPTTSSDNITITDGTLTSTVVGGLTAGLPYNFSLVTVLGSDSSSLQGPVAATPTAFPGCTTSGTLTDTDPDLLVHYPFSNNLNDAKNLGTTGSPYNLTNVTSWGGNSVSGTIKYAQGCAYGQAAYFDSTTGHLVNDDFNDTNVTALADNYTVSMWVYPEPSDDPLQQRIALLSGYATGGPDFQFAYLPNTRFNWNAVGGIPTANPYTRDQWYHIALVKHDNGTSEIYVNGVLDASGTSTTDWDLIGMGITRSRGAASYWKGYIDEVKVYGRAFSGNEVVDACLLYGECEKYVTPNTPDNLTASDPGSGTAIDLTWNSVNGADNYTIYWTSNPGVDIDPSNPSTYDNFTTVTGTSTSVTGLTNGTNYDFTVIATNTAGNSSPAAEVSATPTLILPAAMDNVTAYYGFYQNYFSGAHHNMPPAYAVTFNPHPDYESGDHYYIYVSDNLSQPIDPDDSSTYLSRSGIFEINEPIQYAVVQTRPFYTVNGVTYNDGYLENTPIKIGVALKDDSKGDLISPIVEVIPTMASEAYREWGDLRISNGFFKDGDNSTLYSFGKYNGGLPLRIEHKDVVNVGERVIFDGSWLRSDVFPQMGGSIGYDYMYMRWYSPTIMREITTDGTFFRRSNSTGWRLEANSATPNGRCGTGNAEDCDWAMEISSEDTVGLIIQNENGLVYQGYPYSTLTYNGTGTLDGPTDYASEYIAPQTYTSNQVGSYSRIDNASYTGFRIGSTRNIFQINLANADAAIRKVGIAFPPPANLTVTPSGSNINLSWDNSTALSNTYDIYRSTDNASWTLVTSISGYGNTTYTDSSLADGTYYYKIGANGTYFSPDNSTVASGVIATTPAAPVLNSVTAGVQQNTIAWSAYTGATGFKLYWDTSASVSTSDNLITISDNSSTSYIHSGRTAGTEYFYRLIATTASGDSALSNELSDTPTAFVGCTSSGAVADNDPDLLVHYAFEGNLEDIEDTNGDNRYDLTNEEGTMQFAQGCAQGQAAYIDSASGYGVNDNFTSTNVGGNLASDNFSISLWLAKDGDMADYSSAFNTGFYNEHTPTGDQEKTQIDIQGGKFRAISNSPGNGKKVTSSFTPNMDQWYHVTLTHSPPSTVSLYVDGDFQQTNTNMNIDFYGLVVGLNRSRSVGTLNWKGYIDEVKVFNRTFSADDVATDCMKSEECSYVPATAPTLSADARAQAIMLTWNLPGGTDNATIYWRTSGGSFEGSPTAPTASDNVINVTNGQTSYLLTGLTGGDYYHFVILANNRNGSSPVSSVLGNVQPSSFVSNILGAENGGICKLQNDNSLHCRGRNILNQLRDGSTADIPAAIDVFGVTNAEAIHYDMNKVSVLKSDSSYQHRGDDDGYGTQSSSVTGVTNPIQIEQGYNFVAYLLSDGTIRTRGRNLYGQLGDGTNTDETSGSVQVSGITTATKIAAGTYHACALLSNGQVWCWGVNSLGELGDGTTTNRNSPVQASLPSNTAVDITIGSRATGAVMADGSVYVWGDNAGSKLKCNTNENDISTPRNLAAFTNAQKIAIGLNHTVMLSNDGNVYTCGENYNLANVVGNAAFLTAQGATAWQYTNGAIQMDDYQGRVVDIDTDHYNSYMLLDNGSLACIGDNNYGQCNNDGVTTGTDQLTPIIMPDM